jgi:hypothetical protein
MHQERALDPDPKGDFADRESLRELAAPPANDYALEYLHALSFALDNPHMHSDGVAGPKVGHIVPQMRALDYIDRVHLPLLRGSS